MVGLVLKPQTVYFWLVGFIFWYKFVVFASYYMYNMTGVRLEIVDTAVGLRRPFRAANARR